MVPKRTDAANRNHCRRPTCSKPEARAPPVAHLSEGNNSYGKSHHPTTRDSQEKRTLDFRSTYFAISYRQKCLGEHIWPPRLRPPSPIESNETSKRCGVSDIHVRISRHAMQKEGERTPNSAFPQIKVRCERNGGETGLQCVIDRLTSSKFKLWLDQMETFAKL